jgi:RHS repeat-associated protein
MLGGLSSTTQYGYDAANRLSSAGPVSYSFDANGNLLSDGTNTYSYDAANRLVSTTSSGQATVTYAYNGMGDRVQQTAAGQTTTYTMDYNAGLTQVLDDGANAYLYGVGRIAQESQPVAGAPRVDYFLGDALGSIRQMTDASGAITLAKAYDPYGAVSAASGVGSTNYGFTGEQTDPSGFIYLRTRYYSPNMGRFVSRDTWRGDDQRPQSLNRYDYVGNDPVNLSDPSGRCYGVAAFIREREPVICANLDMAVTIYNHPNASFLEKVGAGTYIYAWSASHLALVAGVLIITGATVASIATWAVAAGTEALAAGGTAGAATAATVAAGATGAAVEVIDCVEEKQATIDEFLQGIQTITPVVAQTTEEIAEELVQMGPQAQGAPELIDKLAEAATQNSGSNLVVLGPHRGLFDYVEAAKAATATYYEMKDAIWSILEKNLDAARAVYVRFVLNQMAQGKDIMVGLWDGAEVGEWTQLELQTLQENAANFHYVQRTIVGGGYYFEHIP